MTVYNDPETGLISVHDGSRRVWDSQYPPVNLLPNSDWIELNSYPITFPDFQKGCYYFYAKGALGPTFIDYCQTFSAIIPGEYGPEGSGPLNIPEIKVGEVPDGCNFLDVRASFIRTKNPTNFRGEPVPLTVPAGQEMYLPGGSAILETSVGWRRLVDFRISGTDVMMRRRQSVRTTTNPVTGPPYDENGLSASPNRNDMVLCEVIQLLEGTGHTRYRDSPFGNSCSMNTNVHDFSSIYTGQIVIRPGYIAP